MQLNGYPEKLIIKTIKHCYLLANQKIAKTWKPQNYLYHMQRLYEKGIAEQLKPVANRCGLKMIFTTSLPLKSKLPINPFKNCSACGVVYKVTCSCYKKYIEETGRTIEERIKEHQRDINDEKSVEKNSRPITTFERK